MTFDKRNLIMSNSKILPIVFIVASLVGGSAMMATAQDAPVAPTTTTTTVEPAAPIAKPGILAALKAKFSGQGFGKHGGDMLQAIMVDVDADKNGSVTQAEMDTFRTAKVAAADTSKDGAINLDEFSVAYNELMRARMVDAFQNFDDDGNGSITVPELDARFGSIVAKMDRNGDGALSKDDRPQHDGKGGKRKHHGDDRDGGDNN
jgi:EF hand